MLPIETIDRHPSSIAHRHCAAARARKLEGPRIGLRSRFLDQTLQLAALVRGEVNRSLFACPLHGRDDRHGVRGPTYLPQGNRCTNQGDGESLLRIDFQQDPQAAEVVRHC